MARTHNVIMRTHRATGAHLRDTLRSEVRWEEERPLSESMGPQTLGITARVSQAFHNRR